MTIEKTDLPEYVRPYKYDDSMDFRNSEMEPVHESDITDSGVIAAVRRAYRDSKPNRDVETDGHRRLRFVTDWYHVGDRDMTTAVGFIGEYNNFSPPQVQDLLHALPRDTYVAIGREGSPALYFYTTEPFDVVLGLRDLKFSSPDELDVCYTDVYPSGQYDNPNSDPKYIYDMHAERADIDTLRNPEHPVLIRAWWD